MKADDVLRIQRRAESSVRREAAGCRARVMTAILNASADMLESPVWLR